MDSIGVMIVDDETMALEYLRDLIPWEEAGYRIVAEATDGKSAVELFASAQPQIVISDICMPGVNGLDMCAAMLEQNPSARILLLTAYREFEYAKRAIEMGIKNYILKHELSADRLTGELERIRKDIVQEKDTDRILAKYAVVNTIAEYDDESLDADWQRRTLEKYGKTFILLVIKEDRPYPIFADPGAGEGHEDIREALDEVLHQDLPDGYSCIDCFTLQRGTWALFFSHDDFLTTQFFKKNFRPVIDRVLEGLGGNGDVSYSAVAMMSVRKLNRISSVYHQARQLLEQGLFDGRGSVIFMEDGQEAGATAPVLGTAQRGAPCARELKAFKAHLTECDFGGAELDLGDLFDELHRWRDPETLRDCIDELTRIMDAWAAASCLPPLEAVLCEPCYTLEEVRDFFTLSLDELRRRYDPSMGSCSKRVRDALAYLYEHYGQDISVSDVAGALGISESSLSKACKAETGKSVVDYLTEIRVAAAKRLLRSTDLKVYQVAEKVGYRTSQYFSQVFLKAAGTHPLAYRACKDGDTL